MKRVAKLIALFLVLASLLLPVSAFAYNCDSEQIEEAEPDTKDLAMYRYWSDILIPMLVDQGYKKNAIVGFVSYLLCEAGGAGTYAYEACWLVPGPSGLLMDTTNDNTAWSNWMDEAKESLHEVYYSNSGIIYASVGLGLMQWSNIWYDEGNGPYLAMNSADRLIQRANALGLSWQSPWVQSQVIVETLNLDSSWDCDENDFVDPKSDNLTPEEWCARITCGIGIPSIKWNDVPEWFENYLNNHLGEIDRAYRLVSLYMEDDEVVDKTDSATEKLPFIDLMGDKYKLAKMNIFAKNGISFLLLKNGTVAIYNTNLFDLNHYIFLKHEYSSKRHSTFNNDV